MLQSARERAGALYEEVKRSVKPPSKVQRNRLLNALVEALPDAASSGELSYRMDESGAYESMFADIVLDERTSSGKELGRLISSFASKPSDATPRELLDALRGITSTLMQDLAVPAHGEPVVRLLLDRVVFARLHSVCLSHIRTADVLDVERATACRCRCGCRYSPSLSPRHSHPAAGRFNAGQRIMRPRTPSEMHLCHPFEVCCPVRRRPAHRPTDAADHSRRDHSAERPAVGGGAGYS